MLEPSANNVLIRPAAVKEKTDSGLFLPDAAVERPIKGTVAAVGINVSDEISIGDEVLYQPYAGTALKIDGEILSLMRGNDIVAIIE
jgi:chaperonin GroES